MLPVQFDPALILSGPPRPAGSQPNPLASLTPGEAVQAIVLDVLDDGLLRVLVKGLELQASSLVGRLPVGQVLEAHVESRDGQILLRLDQPVTATTAGRPEPLFTDQIDPAGGVRLAVLLKSLLPADEPLAGGLARLAASLTEAVERGQVSSQTLAGFDSLRKQILLEGEQGGTAVDGKRLPEVLRALGLRHERDLLEDWKVHGSISWRSGQNLKSWLMGLLEESGADPAVPAPPAMPSASQPASPAGMAGQANLPPPAGGQAQDQRQVTVSRPAVGAVESVAQDRPPVGDKAAEPVARSFPPFSLPSDETGGRPSAPEPLTGDETVRGDEGGVSRQNAQKNAAAPSSEPLRAATPRAEAEGPPAQSFRQASDEAQDQESDPVMKNRQVAGPYPGIPSTVKPQMALAAAALRRLATLPGPAAGSEETPAVVAVPPMEQAWVKDAQQLLTVLERTQALARLNVQSGQPLCFDLPLAWGGQAQVRVYVETRDGGKRTPSSEPRPYNVVTLLELDGLGAVRVDTVLTGKRLSARFLLDQPAVERAVAGLLPALTRSLSARGYQVEVLTSGTADPRHVRGDDLQVKAAPKVSLVNCKA